MANVMCVSYVVFCVCLHLVYGQFGFYPNQREDRRFGNPFGFVANFLQNNNQLSPKRNGWMQRPQYPGYDQNYYNNRPIANQQNYDVYGRPYPNSGNTYYEQYGNQPVRFPTSIPQEAPVNTNYQPNSNQNYPEYTNQEQNAGNYPENNADTLNNPENNPKNNPNSGTVVDAEVNQENFKDNTQSPTVQEVPESYNKETVPNFEDRNGGDIAEAPAPAEFPKPDFIINGIPNVPPSSNLPPLTPVPQNDESSQVTTEPPTTQGLIHVPPPTSANDFRFSQPGVFHETCTINNKIGTCINILECEPIAKLLKMADNAVVVQALRKAHCGFDGNNPKVCCPRPGIPTAVPTEPTTTTTTTTEMVIEEKHSVTNVFLDPPVCGASNASFSRVVGGVPAKLGDFPWMALLGYKRRDAVRWLCGGSIVTSKVILTAAHCVHGHESTLYVVRVGELDLSKEDEGATPVDYLIKKQIKHAAYDANSYENDIALLLLEGVIQFTDLIKPICIPYEQELRARSFERYNPLIAGWGDLEFRGPSSDTLQVVQLPVVSQDFCEKAYSAYAKQVIDGRVLCAGYEKGGKDACQGDSGGPLMQPIWNSKTMTTYFYQIGVTSFGRKCAEAGFPGVYTRVTDFVPWIEEQIRANE